MAFEELDTPIPAVPAEEQPDIMAYSLLQSFVADLQPRETTPGVSLWSELRYRYTGELNYPRWSKDFPIGGAVHTVFLSAVSGEKPGGIVYGHTALRCSCSLPDHKSFADLEAEYQPCPAKDMVIRERVGVYRQLLGVDRLGKLDGETLHRATTFLLELVRREAFIWPPSDRSDRVLIEPVAEVYGVSKGRMLAEVKTLASEDIVVIHGDEHPSMSLKAA